MLVVVKVTVVVGDNKQTKQTNTLFFDDTID